MALLRSLLRIVLRVLLLPIDLAITINYLVIVYCLDTVAQAKQFDPEVAGAAPSENGSPSQRLTVQIHFPVMLQFRDSPRLSGEHAFFFGADNFSPEQVVFG